MKKIKLFFRSVAIRLSTLRNLFSFFAKNKLWWMFPMILILVIFFLFIILGQSTPLGPFIYTIF